MTAQLTTMEIEKIVARIVMFTRPERILMFGSYAKGRATLHSDLDPLVVMPTDTPYLPKVSDVEPYLGGWAVPIDIHVVTADELYEYGKRPYHFLHSVRRSGLTVYPLAAMGDSANTLPSLQCAATAPYVPRNY